MSTSLYKDILQPNKGNVFIYVTAFFMLFMLFTGKASPLTIVFAYVLETIIIGFFNILKMAYTAKVGKLGDSKKSGLVMILFFIFHYGMFVIVQSVFMFSFFENAQEVDFGIGFNILNNFNQVLHLENIQYILGFIILSNAGYFYQNFVLDKQYEKYTVSELMYKPYLRIIVQQFVVIVSGFFFTFLGNALVVAVLLIVFRLALDLAIVAIKENSKLLDNMALWVYENQKKESLSYETIRKQILLFTE